MSNAIQMKSGNVKNRIVQQAANVRFLKFIIATFSAFFPLKVTL